MHALWLTFRDMRIQSIFFVFLEQRILNTNFPPILVSLISLLGDLPHLEKEETLLKGIALGFILLQLFLLFYSHIILILFSYYFHILILFSYYSHIILILLSYYPHIILILSSYYSHILILFSYYSRII